MLGIQPVLPAGVLPGVMEQHIGTEDLFSPMCPGCPEEYIRLRYVQGLLEGLPSAMGMPLRLRNGSSLGHNK